MANPNPLEQLLLINQIAGAFDSIVTNVAAFKSVDFGKVIAYEFGEFDKLDDKGKATGEKYNAAILTLVGGTEIELTEEENKIFRPFWNMKCKIDGRKYAFASAIFNQMFPEPEKK